MKNNLRWFHLIDIVRNTLLSPYFRRLGDSGCSAEEIEMNYERQGRHCRENGKASLQHVCFGECRMRRYDGVKNFTLPAVFWRNCKNVWEYPFNDSCCLALPLTMFILKQLKIDKFKYKRLL